MEKTKPIDWGEINKHFGPVIEAQLKENTGIKQTITGGFVLPEGNENVVEDCQHFYRKPTRKISKIDRNVKFNQESINKCKPEVFDSMGKDTFQLFANFRRNLSSDLSRESSDYFSGSSQTSNVSQTSRSSQPMKTIKNPRLLKTPRYVDKCNYESFENSHIFSKKISTRDKLRKFIGHGITEFEPCIVYFEQVFAEFLCKHTKFKYKYILRDIIDKRPSANGRISQKQLRKFFGHILYRVVPVELFGSRNNRKHIKKMIFHYFRTPFGQYFSAQSVINKLKIDDVQWLDIIGNDDKRNLIMSILVESFFCKYIMAVLGTYIYTEKMVSTNKEKTFYQLGYWLTLQKKYIQQRRRKGIYKLLDNQNFDDTKPFDVPNGLLTLHFKKDGIRPILLASPTEPQKENASILNKLLYQLYLKKFELVRPQTVENLWRNLHKKYSDRVDKPLYFVSCDIHDAFGSINLEKLFDIISGMLAELEDQLPIHDFVTFDPRHAHTQKYVYRKYFNCPSLPLAFPQGTLSTRNSTNAKKYQKKYLEHCIKRYVLDRKIWINDRLYQQTRGIGQGVNMSSMLCEIYYGNMVLEEFGDYMRTGRILRYVDDFLYVTDDRTSAERFLHQIQRGSRNYNCKFNVSKTSTNLPPYCAEQFDYLGYTFNIRTFDVAPKFSDTSVRYLISLKRPAEPSAASNILKARLENQLSLKAKKFVLDPSFISKKTLDDTIHKIAMLSAKRCYALIINLFDPPKISAIPVFNLIKNSSIKPLIYKICGYGSMNREEVYRVRVTIWKAYLQVFRGNVHLYKKFGHRLKERLLRIENKI